jgi:hypothetical protein
VNRWRRRVPAIVFLAPLIAGAMLTLFGEPRFGAGMEAGGLTFLALIALGVTVAMLRGRTFPVQPGRFSPNLNRRRPLWIPIFLAGGIAGAYVGSLFVADWFVPTDRVAVVIRSVSHSFRGGDSIVTDHGRFTTPWLLGFEEDPRPGPAIAVIGHFSHTLLGVEAVAP